MFKGSIFKKCNYSFWQIVEQFRLNMKIKLIGTMLILLAQTLFPQRLLKLTLNYEGKRATVSYLTKRDLVFASAKELSKALNLNYYYNTTADKIEIKAGQKRLKFTARNQYVVLTNLATDGKEIFQMPLSTLLIKKDIFLPLKYSLEYLQLLTGKEILFNPLERELTVTGKPFAARLKLASKEKTLSPKGEVKPPKKISNYDIFKIEVSEKSNGTLIRLSTSKKIKRFSSSINEGTLFLFLSGVSVDPNLLKGFKPAGFVRSAKMKNVAGNIQLEFKLKKGYETEESFLDPDNGDLLITIHSKIFTQNSTDLDRLVKKWKFNVVVIDPGHGGKDAGAIGVTGVKEKDVNLAIALKLGKLIKRNLKNIKVVFTRKTDKFVELYKRGKIANEHHGNLFISIHCNSLIKKPSSTNGFEIYLLRPGRTKEAIRIAEFENSVIKYETDPQRYKKLTAENFILVSMARSAFMRYSEKFSELLNEEYSKHTRIKSRGVRQAGFYVLVGASMPGVLVETGYLSNYRDEAYLKSSKGQAAIEKSIFLAIKRYIDYYQKTVKKESE